jgi:hypothetical protein
MPDHTHSQRELRMMGKGAELVREIEGAGILWTGKSVTPLRPAADPSDPYELLAQPTEATDA